MVPLLDSSSITPTDVPSYQVVSRRWGVLAAFCLSNAMNAFLWICFAPVVYFTESYFNVSITAVNMLSLVFMIIYIPVVVPSLWFTERYGLRKAILMAILFNCIGAWLRYIGAIVANVSSAYQILGFGIVMIGQCIAAAAQTVFINAPARIAGDWFAVDELATATTIASMANPIGNALGSALPGILMTGPDDIPYLCLYQGIISTVFLIIAGFVITADHPPTPPSAAAAAKLAKRRKYMLQNEAHLPIHTDHTSSILHSTTTEGTDSTGMVPTTTTALVGDPHSASGINHHRAKEALEALEADLYALLSNRNFFYLAVGFGVGLGVFNALLTLIAQLLAPCGYGDDISSYAGGGLLLAGLIGAGIAGAVLDRTKAYIPLLRTLILITVAAMIFMLSSLRKNAEIEVIISFSLMGSCLIPLLPISLENSAECTYPVQEDNSASFLLGIGQIVGIIAIFALTPLLEDPNDPKSCSTVVTPSGGFLLALMILAGLCLVLFRKDYRRQKEEGIRKQETNGES